MAKLLVILCARYASERRPGKVVADICGKPLLTWLIERMTHPQTGVGGEVIVATTANREDDAVEQAAWRGGVSCYRHPGDPADVVGRLAAVIEAHPEAELIMRGLGDCPLLATEIVRRSAHVLGKIGDDLFLWYTPPSTWPLYGSREFPSSRRAWLKIIAGARGDEREHPDLYINRNRRKFSVTYHDPPDSVYFRHPQRMRVEVDYPQDLELIRAVAERGPGMLAPLPDIIRWLDDHEEVTALNRHLSERTGPAVSYDNKLHREWYKLMNKASVYTWDNRLISPLDQQAAQQICCTNCGQLLGWGWEGRLYARDGAVIGEGRVNCPNCQATRVWRRAL